MAGEFRKMFSSLLRKSLMCCLKGPFELGARPVVHLNSPIPSSLHPPHSVGQEKAPFPGTSINQSSNHYKYRLVFNTTLYSMLLGRSFSKMHCRGS